MKWVKPVLNPVSIIPERRACHTCKIYIYIKKNNSKLFIALIYQNNILVFGGVNGNILNV